MRDDHEELIAHNPMLLSRCFWHLAQKFSEKSGGSAPNLPVFLISTAILFHEESIEKIHRMQFDSGILKAILERPDLLGGLQARLEASLKPSLTALQLAVASKILVREGGHGFPTFRAAGTNLPVALRDAHFDIQMIGAAKRLGAWFAIESIAVVQRRFAVEF